MISGVITLEFDWFSSRRVQAWEIFSDEALLKALDIR